MYCCKKKCNIHYLVISLIIILLVWNISLTVIVQNSKPSHINSFNYAPENLQVGGYITFDTNRVIEKNDITHNATIYGTTIGETVENAYKTV